MIKNGNDTSLFTGGSHWKSNLTVCLLGSFSTIVAMTLLLPFLPLYVQQLGIIEPSAIAIWSGVVYSATFFSAALTAPLWGRLADRYGRKLMLLRASLGMAIVMSLLGLAHNVWQLAGLRLLAGLLGGYASGSTILVASQTPKTHTGRALGLLSAGIMAGNLAGPLIGGYLPSLIGIRNTFFCSGALIFFAFLGTAMFIKDPPRKPVEAKSTISVWSNLPNKAPFIAMLATGFLLMVANMSIEPIITLFIGSLVPASKVTTTAGLAMSVAALGSMLSAAHLGKLADCIGHWQVVILCLTLTTLLLPPQAWVSTGWQLIALRFAMGLALGGLLPCIASVIRHHVPEQFTGTALGYSVSTQYTGQVFGPLLGATCAAHLGLHSVFFVTSALVATGALGNFLTKRMID